MVTISKWNDDEKRSHKCVRAKVVIEVLGRPKDHVEKTRDDVLSKIKEDEEYEVAKEYLAEAKEEDEGFFSSFMELDLWFVNMSKLLSFTLYFLPAHIEMIEPEQQVIKLPAANEFLSELAMKMHRVDELYQEAQAERDQLNRALTKVLDAAILAVVDQQPRTQEEIGKLLGILPEGLTDYLGFLASSGKLTLGEEDKKFHIGKLPAKNDA